MVFEKVKGMILEQLNIEENIITEESLMVDDLGADSLDLVDLVMMIEEEFDLTVPDDVVESIVTVGDIVRTIELMLS